MDRASRHSQPSRVRPGLAVVAGACLFATLAHPAAAQDIDRFLRTPSDSAAFEWQAGAADVVYVVERSSGLDYPAWWKANGLWPIGRTTHEDLYSLNSGAQIFRIRTIQTAHSPPAYSVLTSIPYPGDPGALEVTENHDLVVFGLRPGESKPYAVQFLKVEYTPGSDSFAFDWAEERIPLKHDGNAIPERGFMGYDRFNDVVFVLDSSRIGYESMKVNVIRNRQSLKTITYNDSTDYWYSVQGFAVKPAYVEGNSVTRLVINDYIQGNLDILDVRPLNPWFMVASQERYSYRARFGAPQCTWPDTDPGPFYQCSGASFFGNRMTAEWRLETAPAGADPLANCDRFYFMEGRADIHVLDLGHPGQPLDPVVHPDIKLSTTFLTNGTQGLYASDRVDRIHVVTALGSFDYGWLARIDTAAQTYELLNPPGFDRGMALPDPLCARRVFIPFNSGGVDNKLYVRVLEDGAVTQRVEFWDQPVSGGTAGFVAGMAYDPLYGLLYLSLGSGEIKVVRCPISID